MFALQRYGLLDNQPDPQFDAITSLVRDLLDVPICAVSLVGEEEQWFRSVQGTKPARHPRSAVFCDHTIRTDRPLVVSDAAADPRFAASPLVADGPRLRSYAGAPLRSDDGHNLGALCVIDSEPREFTPSQVSVLERFAGLVMEQLELRTLACRDSLTGLLTRRAFFDAAETLLHHDAPHGSATLVLLDVDHFKAVNDTYGHPIGDRVLQRVVSDLRGALAPGDLFGRYGGEEFVLLLAGRREESAVSVAERLRETVAAMRAEDCPRVTASLGLAAVAAHATLGRAVEAADGALYAAKRQGRNRCVVAEPLATANS